jgi:hypothetical protein
MKGAKYPEPARHSIAKLAYRDSFGAISCPCPSNLERKLAEIELALNGIKETTALLLNVVRTA